MLKYCGRDDLSDILIENDYIVIQIDTDQSQTIPFNISHACSDGQPKPPFQLHSEVIQKLQSFINPRILKKNRNNILFAICIHTIECWLLPLYYTNNQKTSTLNCLIKLNSALRRQNRPTIPQTDKNGSNAKRAYCTVLNDLKRKTDIIEIAQFNYGFEYFINSLSIIDKDATSIGMGTD